MAWVQWEAREEDLEGLKIDALKAAVEFKSKSTTVDDQVAAAQMEASQKVRCCRGLASCISVVCVARVPAPVHARDACSPQLPSLAVS